MGGGGRRERERDFRSLNFAVALLSLRGQSYSRGSTPLILRDTRLPHDGKHRGSHHEVVGLVIEQVADHPVVPFGDVFEIRHGEAVVARDEIVPRSQRRDLHVHSDSPIRLSAAGAAAAALQEAAARRQQN